MPLAVRQVPRGARTSRRKQLRKSNCRSTRGGVRVQEDPETVTGPAPLPREGGARERVPRLVGQPPANQPPPHGGEHQKRTGRGGPTKNPARLRGLKPDSGLHTPRPRDRHGRDSEWCHPQEDGALQAPHLPRDGGPGTGSDQFRGAKDSEVPAEDDLRAGHCLRIREERRAHFS
jgi:hypothetical protein